MERDGEATRPLGPSASDPGAGGPAAAGAARYRRRGELVGPYRIEGELGHGGNGIVYHAIDGATGGAVALKMVHAARPHALGGLRREIRALRQLQHGSIVRILDDGTDETGAPWYAMELLPGPSLRALVPSRAAGPPSWDDEALAIQLAPLLAVCTGLAHLHGEGLVHRDLKPENVLFAADGRPVLTDLGVAVSFAAASTSDRLDALGEIAGTVWYMAPEQLAGALVDARADLYALGAVIHELLTGEPPFPGSDAASVATCHLSATPRPMSERAAGIPPALDAIVLRLLQKSPRDRYGHAVDILAALRAALPASPPGEAAPADAVRPYLYRSELHGRGEMLELLLSHLRRAAAGQGACLLVEGDAGIGKTRLVLEAARQVGSEMLVLSGACHRGGGGLHPLRAPLDTLADWAETDSSDVATRLVDAGAAVLAPLSPPLEALARRCGAAPVVLKDPRDARDRMLRALARILVTAAEVRPLALLLDDLQWADDLTVAFLASVDPHDVARRRIALVAAARPAPVLDPLGRAWAGPRDPRIRLEGLAAAEVAGILGDMLALTEIPRDVSERIAAASGGNPSLVAEQASCLVEEERLSRDPEGRWQLPALPELSPDPWSLARRRVARRSDAACRYLRAAALVGRDAPAAVVEAIAWLDADEGRAAQHELLAARMIEERAPGVLRLAREEIGDAALAGLSPGERRALSARAAATMEPLARQEPQLASVVAAHWRDAGESALELPWRLAAATWAVERFAMSEAERQYRAFLEIAPPGKERAEVRCLLGWRVLAVLGRFRDAEVEHRIALAEAEQLGLVGIQCRALRLLFVDVHGTGAFAEARELILRALELARRNGRREDEAHALNSFAIIESELGDLGAAAEAQRAALEAFRDVGDELNAAIAVGNLGVLHLLSADLPRGAELTEEASTALRVASPWLGIRSIANLGEVRSLQGRHAEAETLLREAVTRAKATGSQRAAATSLKALATAMRLAGRAAEARESAELSLVMARQIADASSELEARTEIARVALLDRSAGDALALAEESLARARAGGDVRQRIAALEAAADAQRAVGGGLSIAGGYLDEAIALAVRTGALLLELPLRTMRARVRRLLGERAGDDVARSREILARTGLGPGSPLVRDLATEEEAARGEAPAPGA